MQLLVDFDVLLKAGTSNSLLAAGNFQPTASAG